MTGQGGGISWELALLIMRDMARALVHLHSRRVVHRDLKEDNVLVFLAADGTYLCCKLADVGFAKVRVFARMHTCEAEWEALFGTQVCCRRVPPVVVVCQGWLAYYNA